MTAWEGFRTILAWVGLAVTLAWLCHLIGGAIL